MMIRGEFWVPGTLPGWNDLLNERAKFNKKWNGYTQAKRDAEKEIGNHILGAGLPRFPAGVRIWYDFHEPTRRRDPSNFAGGAIKLIEDTLVRCGIIKGDGWEHMLAIYLNWRHDKDNPGIRVTILGDGNAELPSP